MCVTNVRRSRFSKESTNTSIINKMRQKKHQLDWLSWNELKFNTSSKFILARQCGATCDCWLWTLCHTLQQYRPRYRHRHRARISSKSITAIWLATYGFLMFHNFCSISKSVTSELPFRYIKFNRCRTFHRIFVDCTKSNQIESTYLIQHRQQI